MALLALALVAGLVIGVVQGGRLGHVVGHPIRRWWLLMFGLACQYEVDHWGHGGTVVLLAGYGFLLAFAAANWALVGIGVVAVGVATNALVIGANGGMPVRAQALTAAGLATPAEVPLVRFDHRHHLEQTGDVLKPLDDAIGLKTLGEVISVGDLIVAFGLADVGVHLTRSRRRFPSASAPSPARSGRRFGPRLEPGSVIRVASGPRGDRHRGHPL